MFAVQEVLGGTKEYSRNSICL